MFSYCKYGLLFFPVEIIKNGSLRNIQPILVVDCGNLTGQYLTKRLNTFNLVFAARNILVLEDSNETHGAIIVEIAKALVNCVSLVLYGALMSYKSDFHKPFTYLFAELRDGRTLLHYGIIVVKVKECLELANLAFFGEHMILDSFKCRKKTNICGDLVIVMVLARYELSKSSEELVFKLGKQRIHSSCNLDFLFMHFGLSKEANLDHLCSVAISMVVIQMFLNYILKLQGLLCIILNDWNPSLIRNVWNKPFHHQGASTIESTASPLLKLFQTPMVVAAHFSPRKSQLVLNQFVFVAIFHRKMIHRGNVRDAKVLDKWKALPLKHNTCVCSDRK